MQRSDLVRSASELFLLVKGSNPTVESCPIQIDNMLGLERIEPHYPFTALFFKSHIGNEGHTRPMPQVMYRGAI
jgi:hypothetical protein